MGAIDVLSAIAQAGGTASLRDDGLGVTYRNVPKALADRLRYQQTEVFNLLLRQAAQSHGITRWLAEHSVASHLCRSSQRILYRQYCSWCRAENIVPSTTDVFASVLAERGWNLDEDGFVVGLVLSEDFLLVGHEHPHRKTT